MNDPALPTTFEPDYGTVVSRILPGFVAVMFVCGTLLMGVPHSVGPSLGWVAFGLAAGFLGLYLWYVIYSEIEFHEDGIVVRRHLFPDVEGSYRDVTSVSSKGFRLGGFPVGSHTMENAPELRSIVRGLVEEGRIQPTGEKGVTEEIERNLAATATAVLAGVVLWVVIEAFGLAPAALPDALTSYGLLFLAVVVGAPAIKRLSA